MSTKRVDVAKRKQIRTWTPKAADRPDTEERFLGLAKLLKDLEADLSAAEEETASARADVDALKARVLALEEQLQNVKPDNSPVMPLRKRAPSVKGSKTSEESAATENVRLGERQRAVLAVLLEAGRVGKTDEEIEGALGLTHQSASARRRELVLAGLVRDSGARKRNRTGKRATVWSVLETRARAYLNGHAEAN